MSTTTPLTDNINALTAYSNQKTGANDTNLSDAVTRLVNGYGSGGGYNGIEYVIDSNNKITNVIFHGLTSIPNFVFDFWGNDLNANSVIPTVSFATKPTHIGGYAFKGAKVKIDFSGLSDVETIGGEHALALNWGATNLDQSNDVASLPKFVGYTSGATAVGLFRLATPTLYVPKVYRLPSVVYIPQYCWYSCKQTDLDIEIGSIGKTVVNSGDRPFGGTSSASGTVTIYTTADYLTNLNTKVTSQAGSNLTFIYKASGQTTYNGTTYGAGETITL